MPHKKPRFSSAVADPAVRRKMHSVAAGADPALTRIWTSEESATGHRRRCSPARRTRSWAVGRPRRRRRCSRAGRTRYWARPRGARRDPAAAVAVSGDACLPGSDPALPRPDPRQDAPTCSRRPCATATRSPMRTSGLARVRCRHAPSHSRGPAVRAEHRDRGSRRPWRRLHPDGRRLRLHLSRPRCSASPPPRTTTGFASTPTDAAGRHSLLSSLAIAGAGEDRDGGAPSPRGLDPAVLAEIRRRRLPPDVARSSPSCPPAWTPAARPASARPTAEAACEPAAGRTAEVFDPEAGRWLPAGRTAEVFHPEAGRWLPAAPRPGGGAVRRRGGGREAVRDGRVGVADRARAAWRGVRRHGRLVARDGARDAGGVDGLLRCRRRADVHSGGVRGVAPEAVRRGPGRVADGGRRRGAARGAAPARRRRRGLGGRPHVVAGCRSTQDLRGAGRVGAS
ncbi:hypothetical protein PVAP13_5NG309500 [Panicum virgatum]|uniref:Uncharacterized protein n=1 Tax=Panicum virgatum TaxID=38727 RepID=A0A8T0RZ69_PANVG|nr:hypothetical protein PVAP13_5NG309500 [Panicum virgatum]